MALLSGEEREIAYATFADASRLPMSARAEVYEAINTYLFHKKQRNYGKLAPADEGLLRESLLARSRLPAHESQSVEVPEFAPHQGHAPHRLNISLGYDTEGGQWFQELRVRFGVHDLLNLDAGYLANAQIEVLDLVGRYGYSDRRLRWEGLEIFRAIAVPPLTRLEPSPSWKVRWALDQAAMHIEGGLGASLAWANNMILTTGLLQLSVEKGFGTPDRLNPGMEVSGLVRFHPLHRLQILGSWWLPWSELQVSYAWSIAQNLEWRSAWKQVFSRSGVAQSPWEGMSGLSWFF